FKVSVKSLFRTPINENSANKMRISVRLKFIGSPQTQLSDGTSAPCQLKTSATEAVKIAGFIRLPVKHA
ncbi:MAG TPA: hypothetical protein VFV48_05845, partial [Pseudomonadales bacterium]|nr:hypothetical protein [Pseudomonadales bacterium]